MFQDETGIRGTNLRLMFQDETVFCGTYAGLYLVDYYG